MNYTQNYHLPTWAMTDRIQMEDFNDMTAQLDTALAAEKTARQDTDTAQQNTLNTHTTQIAKLGNCQVYAAAYTGDGTHSDKVFTFPAKPLAVFLQSTDRGDVLLLVQGVPYGYGGRDSFVSGVEWSGNTLKVPYMANSSTKLNSNQVTYHLVALLDMAV